MRLFASVVIEKRVAVRQASRDLVTWCSRFDFFALGSAGRRRRFTLDASSGRGRLFCFGRFPWWAASGTLIRGKQCAYIAARAACSYRRPMWGHNVVGRGQSDEFRKGRMRPMCAGLQSRKLLQTVVLRCLDHGSERPLESDAMPRFAGTETEDVNQCVGLVWSTKSWPKWHDATNQ